MSKITVELTEQEHGIIQSALNAYWSDANEQLSNGGVMMYTGEKRPLGDIEEQLLHQRKELVLPVIAKFENP